MQLSAKILSGKQLVYPGHVSASTVEGGTGSVGHALAAEMLLKIFPNENLLLCQNRGCSIRNTYNWEIDLLP